MDLLACKCADWWLCSKYTSGANYVCRTCTTGAAALKFHEYSRKNGWQNPTDSKHTALMHAYGTDKDMFSWIQSQGYGTYFNDHMAIYRPVPWMSTGRFPIEEQLIDGADKSPNAPFWVDIGGCVGRDLMDLHHFYPQVPGKLILQDLPPVINEIKKINPAITAMEYDFLTEQPVKGTTRSRQMSVSQTITKKSVGSRAYYMHSVLHDWPDDICQKILSRIIDAMKRGYSKLLIHESVVPPTNASWETTARDIIMMTHFSSQERNEADWRNLLEGKAGLRISKIWKLDMPDECLIECELP
ncbi:catechol o-methyltransferase protein [Rutstroemia sp. NJR-2017a BVV2]|nr:catechol o-methyltransferase protein [Rutstroemia sp. NJR-2017a BVV2]